MSWILTLTFSIVFILIAYVFVIGYPKYGWFKKLMHDKIGIHVYNSNYIEYDEDSNTVNVHCKYCNVEMRYFNICKYAILHEPENIPDIAFDSYCNECQTKNYTRGHDCCPRNCNEISTCNYCEKDWDIK